MTLLRRRAGAMSLESRQATGSPELVVPAEIKIPGLHQALLLSHEPALEEALERRLLLGPEEEGVAGHEVHGRHVEADGLHDVPRKLPECEPHEAGSLDDQVGQTAPQLPTHLERRGAVNVRLLCLHGLQLFPYRVIFGNRKCSRYGYGLLDCFDNLKLLRKRTKHFDNLLGCSPCQGRSIKERAILIGVDCIHEDQIKCK